MPRLRVLVGESPESLKPISANKAGGYSIKTSAFEGEISVFLKNFVNERGELSTADYFDHTERQSDTWSIQARGRFLKELNADDVMFGNIFDRALPLPRGSGAALKFMKLRDPTLEDDLYGEKPWALSPLITTMRYVSVTEEKRASNTLPNIVEENASSVVPVGQTRRDYFQSAENRKALSFKPGQYIECDFCHGLLSFETGLSVSFPVVTFDLMRYWDGRPLWFVCCERAEGGRGPGPVMWCVGFEIMDKE